MLATVKRGLLISDKLSLSKISKTAILTQARLDMALLLCFSCIFEMYSYPRKHACTSTLSTKMDSTDPLVVPPQASIRDARRENCVLAQHLHFDELHGRWHAGIPLFRLTQADGQTCRSHGVGRRRRDGGPPNCVQYADVLELRPLRVCYPAS